MATAADGQKRAARPRRGDELELEIDSLAQGGRGVARTAEGFVVFVAGGLPGDRVRARVGKSKKSLRRGGSGRAARARARADRRPLRPRRRALPGRRLAGAPLRAPARSTSRPRSPRRSSGSAASRASSSSRSSPAVEQWRYRNKLEYSFGAGRRRRRRPGARLPRPRPLGPGRRRRRLPARLRGQQRRPQRGPRLGARRGRCRAFDRVDAERRPAQPRRPRGPPHRPDPDPPRHRRRRDPRAARSTCTRSSRATAGGTEGPTGVARRGAPARAARRARASRSPPAPSSRPTPRWPSGSTRSRASTPALGGGERLFDLFCGIGTIGLQHGRRRRRGLGDRERAAGDRRRRARTPQPNGIGNAHFRAADARLGIRPLIEEAGKPDVVVIDPPRAGLSAKIVRRVLECEARADRLRLLQPDDAGAERRGRWSTPAIGCCA